MHISHTILSPICFIFTLKGKKVYVSQLYYIYYLLIHVNTTTKKKKRERKKEKALSKKNSIDCWMHMRASW